MSTEAISSAAVKKNKYQTMLDDGPIRIGLKPHNISPIAGASIHEGYTLILLNYCGGFGIGFLVDGKNILNWDWSDKEYVARQAQRPGVDKIEDVRNDVEMLVEMGTELYNSGMMPRNADFHLW